MSQAWKPGLAKSLPLQRPRKDRLTAIGANTTYSYIGAGTDRFSKTVSGTTTNFLYDGGNVTEELQGSTYTNIYSAAAEKLSGTIYWTLQDGQPSNRQLLNSSQTVVDTYTTDAYGNSVASSGSATNPYQWNAGGKYYSDYESGLQKVGARYYEPATGRWISQDSLLIAGSMADTQAVNRYLYCGGNPVGVVDAEGHNPLAEWLGAVVFVVGVAPIIPLPPLGIAVALIGFGIWLYGVLEGHNDAAEKARALAAPIARAMHDPEGAGDVPTTSTRSPWGGSPGTPPPANWRHSM